MTRSYAMYIIGKDQYQLEEEREDDSAVIRRLFVYDSKDDALAEWRRVAFGDRPKAKAQKFSIAPKSVDRTLASFGASMLASLNTNSRRGRRYYHPELGEEWTERAKELVPFHDHSPWRMISRPSECVYPTRLAKYGSCAQCWCAYLRGGEHREWCGPDECWFSLCRTSIYDDDEHDGYEYEIGSWGFEMFDNPSTFECISVSEDGNILTFDYLGVDSSLKERRINTSIERSELRMKMSSFREEHGLI